MSYLAIKHIHISAAAISIALFVLRAAWSVAESPHLKTWFARVVPHIIDTILLIAGVALAIQIGPFQPWIIAKVVGIIAYIVVGTIAIKRGKTRATRAIAAVFAVLIFAYIVGIALNKQIWYL